MVAESNIMNEYGKTTNILFKNKSQNKNKYLNIKKCCLKILKISILLLILNFGIFTCYFAHDFIESIGKLEYDKDLKKDILKIKTIDNLYKECQIVENIYNIFQSAKF